MRVSSLGQCLSLTEQTDQQLPASLRLDVVHRYALLVSNSDICCNPFVHVLSNEAGAGQFMTDFLPLTAWSQLSATRVTVRLVVCLSGTAVTTWLFYSSCLVKGPRKTVLVTDLDQFPVRISKDEASFDCCLSGGCERKTTTLWSAALHIPRPHIRMAFYSVIDGENAPHSPQCQFVTSETYVTDLAPISRLKQAAEIRPDRHAFLPS